MIYFSEEQKQIAESMKREMDAINAEIQSQILVAQTNIMCELRRARAELLGEKNIQSAESE